ncbi:putative cytochrome P450 [Lupinus albus]|uniref:Putative cytochrome P450 n=1 Tax=Lupinus albus TaxID=3870 RepID=A0A6A4NRP1_LUPAL|nr:putative cytochrome P450 [Lupinus albus]
MAIEISSWGVVVAIASFVIFIRYILKNVNWFLYEFKLGAKQYSLPPGDLGWPLIGNMLSFLKAFKSTNPDSFLNSYVQRYGNTGIYKVLMFGKPSVIVTTPEGCKKVLTDDDKFTLGWPRSTMELMGEKSFIGIPYDEHRRLRRLTSASINGYEALSIYITFIEQNVISSLDKWSKLGEFEFLTHMRRLTFKIIMHIFLGAESEPIMEALEKEYTNLNLGVRAQRINIPGFAFHKSLKARKNLLAIFQKILDERRAEKKGKLSNKKHKDMIDSLIDVEDENGRRLGDDDIMDIMLMYLNAGHESSGHITMWATYYLQKHPEYLQKAKEEQEEILRKRPPTQKGLILEEVRKMDFLSKVVDETLRLVTFSLMVFREAKTDVHINGYLIPKGWKILTWFRAVHLNPEIYPDPSEFNPYRWNITHKAGEFLPFGAGTRLCPGNDLAKLEISVFLHHFVLNYKIEPKNPLCPIRYLPHTRPTDNYLATLKKVSSP